MSWVSVKERLPETGKQVLCCNQRGGYYIAKYLDKGQGWYRMNYPVHECNPVAWAELPEPYKE